MRVKDLGEEAESGGGTGPASAGWRIVLVRPLAASIAWSKEDGATVAIWVGNHTRVSKLHFLHVLDNHTW